MKRHAWLVVVPALAVALRLLHGPGHIGYDAIWALLWGRQLAHGEIPDFEAPVAPTPHPLANLVSAPLSLLGYDAAITAVLALSWLALAGLVYAAFTLGRELFAWPVGALAAALIATRTTLVNETLQAIVDVPFLALVTAACVLEVRRPRRGLAVPLLLLAAGLLRPEGWLLAGAYAVYALPARDDRIRLVAVLAAAPLLWALFDLLATGDPLYSLHGTQELAAQLDRPREAGTALAAAPAYLRFALGEPAIWLGFAGAAAALLWSLDRALLPGALVVIGLISFIALGFAGLPLLVRYLLLPSVMLAIFAGVAAFGWLTLPAEHEARRAWMVVGLAALALLALDVPDEARRLDRSLDYAGQRRAIQDSLGDLARQPDVRELSARCRLHVPEHRPRPLLAWWLDRPPEEFPSERPKGDSWTALAYADDRTAAVFSVSRPAPPAGAAGLPPGGRRIAANEHLLLYARC
jgi:hypothetical protein